MTDAQCGLGVLVNVTPTHRVPDQPPKPLTEGSEILPLELVQYSPPRSRLDLGMDHAEEAAIGLFDFDRERKRRQPTADLLQLVGSEEPVPAVVLAVPKLVRPHRVRRNTEGTQGHQLVVPEDGMEPVLLDEGGRSERILPTIHQVPHADDAVDGAVETDVLKEMVKKADTSVQVADVEITAWVFAGSRRTTGRVVCIRITWSRWSLRRRPLWTGSGLGSGRVWRGTEIDPLMLGHELPDPEADVPGREGLRKPVFADGEDVVRPSVIQACLPVPLAARLDK